jgi:Ca2+-binding RTX toxin-like protein
VFEGVVEGGAGGNEIDFHTAGKVSLSGEFIGFATVRLSVADSLTLKPLDLAGLIGNAITVIDGNAGDTVSAAALTVGEQATIKGGAGHDVFVGGLGKDIFAGGADADTFDFSAAALTATDAVQGGSGSDELVMKSAGTIAVAGVSGIETYRLANGKPSSLHLTTGNFTGTTGTAITVIDGNGGDTVNTGALASSDRTTVAGGSGNDVFIGGAGTDFFNGHAGNDTFRFSVADLSTSDVVKGGGGNDTLFLTSPGTVTAGGVSGVETYRLANGGANKLTLTTGNFAGAAEATITVEGGNAGNTIDAHLVNPGDHAVMVGGAGKDVFTGGPGNDTFRFSVADLSTSDVVKGGGGNDTLLLTSAGTVVASRVSQVETYDLADGGANKLTLTVGNFAGVTGATITVEGGNSGNTVDAHLVTAGDHAVMVGGAGKDIFTGGPGNDTFKFSIAQLSLSDIVKGGDGNDTLLLTNAGALVAGKISQVETYRLANGGPNELTLAAGNFAGVTGATITVEGGNSGNTIDAHAAGANDKTVMIGGAGKDVFVGGAGNDIFKFSLTSLTTADIVQGGSGNDQLQMTSAGKIVPTGVGGVETYRLASGGANILSLANANFVGTSAATITVIGGGKGNTLSEAGVSASDLAILVGGTAADTLTAGRHARLTGGKGADQFVFATPGSAASPDANTIVDFVHGVDKVVFHDAGFNLGADEGKGTTAPKPITKSLFSPNTNGTFASAANRFAYNAKTGGLFYDADGSGKAHASQRIATLTSHPTLAAGDIFFVR